MFIFGSIRIMAHIYQMSVNDDGYGPLTASFNVGI